MDVFFEQLVPIKRDGKAITIFILAWLIALLLCGLAFLFLGTLFIVAVVGIIFATVKFTGLLNVEYEYILTNGVMDIDRITNKSTRKRLMSFEVSHVTRLEKYNPAFLESIDKKQLVFACPGKSQDAYSKHNFCNWRECGGHGTLGGANRATDLVPSSWRNIPPQQQQNL